MEETQQLLLPDADDVESASVAASRGEAHATASESSRTSLLKNNPELRKIVVALCFTFGFMIVEAVGGYLTGSLAIVTDAAHMFSDSTSFFISFMAILVSQSPRNASPTPPLSLFFFFFFLLSRISGIPLYLMGTKKLKYYISLLSPFRLLCLFLFFFSSTRLRARSQISTSLMVTSGLRS